MQDFGEEDTFCGLDLNVDLPSNKEILNDLNSFLELGTEANQVLKSTKAAPSALVQYSYSSEEEEEVDETINIDPITTDKNALERKATIETKEARTNEMAGLTDDAEVAPAH